MRAVLTGAPQRSAAREPPSLPSARLVGQASAGSDLGPEPPPRRCHAILLSESARGESSSTPAQATDRSEQAHESSCDDGDHGMNLTSSDEAVSDGRELSVIKKVARGTLTVP
jgi:hypothetical protein